LEVLERAHAKINLFLEVLGKRPDGYHELRTIFQSLKLHDTLSFTAREDGRLVLHCSDPSLPLGPENLVWRAADLLRRYYGISAGAEVMIEKNIPVAAGLGGGSSDAAAALRGFSRLWRLPREGKVLASLAAELGADVPFCLQGGTAVGRGRGDVLERLPACPHFYVVLVNPGVAVSTARVYAELKAEELRQGSEYEALRQAIVAGDRERIGRLLFNALETVTFRLFPAVANLKQKVAATGHTLMCGSGATLFVLLDDSLEALKLACDIGEEGLHAWYTETWSGGGANV